MTTQTKTGWVENPELDRAAQFYKRKWKKDNGFAALAEELDVTPQAIYMWKGRIPRGRAYELEQRSRGRFKASRLLSYRNGGST